MSQGSDLQGSELNTSAPDGVEHGPLPEVLTQEPGYPVIAVIALGANLGDVVETLALARAEIAALDGVTVTGESPMVVTDPVGGPEGQPEYLNQVVEVSTTLSPAALLERLQRIELEHGRTREVRWGARTLDLDVITFGSVVSDHPLLTLPHPRALERGFVVIPWSWMDPGAFVGSESVFRVARELEPLGGVRPYMDPAHRLPDSRDAAGTNTDAAADTEADEAATSGTGSSDDDGASAS